MKIKNLKVIAILQTLFLIFLFQLEAKSIQSKIIFKVNNEIITSVDIENEINYLIALNPNLKNLSEKEILEISKKSIIQEKIKSIEISKTFENPSLPKDFLEKLIKNIYSKIGIEGLDNFKVYLNSKKINYEDVLKKIEIEALWNELIVSKFSHKVKVNEENLKELLKKNINKETRSYLMSEIFFEISDSNKLETKYKEILNIINQKGFSNAALKYSISETAKIGGKLDWINENSLNKKIKKILLSKKINEVTEPIPVPGGFLILQINDLKKNVIKKDLNQELKKLIKINKNNQFNQFSKIYFNRVKKDLEINEI